MEYKVVTSKEIIARIQNNYTISTTDWINRSPLWIDDVLADIGAYPVFEMVSESGAVENYLCKLPCNLKLLDGITYNGARLPRMGKKLGRNTDLSSQGFLHPEHAYELRGDSYIVLTFEEGDITFHYRRLPVEQDEMTGIWFPLIPDKTAVKEAMEDFILLKILQKGYTIEGKDLRVQNPAMNPFFSYWGIRGMDYIGTRKRAIASLVTMDADMRKDLSDITRTLLYDYNHYQRDLMG